MTLVMAFAVVALLGAFSELVAGALRRLVRGGSWFAPFRRLASDLRLLVRDRDRASLVEATGLGAAAGGSLLAAGAAVGAVPGSSVLLYLSLLLAAAGGHLAASTPLTGAGEERGRRARLEMLVAEPAFLLALGTVFLRWRTADLEAIRGAHAVLGPGLEVGPPAAAAGLVVAACVLALAGAMRLAPEPGDEAGAGGGPAVAVTLSRWVVSGATALAAGATLAGSEPATGAAWPLAPGILPLLGVAAAAALLLGLARAGAGLMPIRWRLAAAAATAIPAGAAVVLVATG